MITGAEAAGRLVAAARLDPAQVPTRPFGADWFREQDAWLAASAAADSLVGDASIDPVHALMTAAELLTADDAGPEVHDLVAIGFVEAMICSSSHVGPDAAARLIEATPIEVWRIWHQRRERLEALSEERMGRLTGPRSLHSADAGTAMLARCTTYRAESGRHVVLAELVSADRPAPWPLRHPVLTGFLFAAVLATVMVYALLRTF